MGAITNDLDRARHNKFFEGFLLLIAFIIIFIMGCYTGYNDAKDEIQAEVIVRDTCACDRDSLTVDNVYYYIKKDSILYPKIVLAQSVLESSWYTSNVCKTKNNLFGFMTKEGYLCFSNWRASISYYKDFQKRKYKGGDYYTFLSDLPYAESTNYSETVKLIVSKI